MKKATFIVSGLGLKQLIVDGSPIDPRRSAGFKPPGPDPQAGNRFGKPCRRRLPIPPCRIRLQPDMNEAVQEGPGSQDNREQEIIAPESISTPETTSPFTRILLTIP